MHPKSRTALASTDDLEAAMRTVTNFDVLLTVHLSIILETDQPNAQILVL